MNILRPSSALVTSIILFATSLQLATAQSPPGELFVSTRGNDSWSGSLSEPNGAGTDGPFASLERARTAIREARRGQAMKYPTLVTIREGSYSLSRTFHLTSADGGTPETPIRWRAQTGENVRLTGGRPITGSRHVTDQRILSRLKPDAQLHVVTADLSGQGITNYGKIEPRGNPGLELFFRGKRMQLARWPNNDWQLIADVPQTGDSLYNKGLDREKRFDGVPVGRHYGRIAYDDPRPSSWKDPGDVFLHGYWTWDWSDSYQRVEHVDTVRKEITIARPHHNYGYTKHQRFYYLNVLEELDAPGEWYLNRSTGSLYWWPPAPPDAGDVVVSLLEDPLVEFDTCSNVSMEGIQFDCSRGNGVVIRGGSACTLRRCVFTGLGSEAVLIDGGNNNGILDCEIVDAARGAVLLRGGNRQTLEPASNYVRNTHIHDYGEWLRTGSYAVIIDGVGNRVANCLIHDAPFEAIYLRGNDHVIEYNEIHHTMLETGDAGAIHTGRNWTWRGNLIRYNYFHDLQGPGLHGVMGVYLDDWGSGFTVYGNVFLRAGRASMIGGGRDNTFENNLYVQCSPSVHIDARGLGWAGYYFDGTYPTLFEGLKEVHYENPPYSSRYTALASILAEDPVLPRGNRIIRNASFGGRWMDIYDYLAFDFSIVTVKDNLIGDPIVVRRRQDGETGWDPYYLNIDMEEGYVTYRQGDASMKPEFKGNIFLPDSPDLTFSERGIPVLAPTSKAYSLGFKPIPVEQIGLQGAAREKSSRATP